MRRESSSPPVAHLHLSLGFKPQMLADKPQEDETSELQGSCLMHRRVIKSDVSEIEKRWGIEDGAQAVILTAHKHKSFEA